MKKLYGITVPIVTPFDENDHVDVDGLKKLTDFLIDKRIPCLYPAGTTGEMLLMSVEERKLLAETVIGQAAGRAVVFIQVGAMNQSDTIALARHALEAGADGIAVVTPAYYKLSDDALFQYFCNVAQSLPEDFPMYLYGIPQCAVNDISVSLAARVAEACPNVIGIKYSYPDMPRLQEYMQIRNGTFSVLCGSDELLEATVFTGGDGTISGNAQVIPEIFTALWDALEAKDMQKATALQRRANRLSHILSDTDGIANYKTGLKYRGVLTSTAMRAPMVPISTQAEEALISRLEENHFTEL